MKCIYCKNEIKKTELILEKDYARKLVLVKCPRCMNVLFKMEVDDVSMLEGINQHAKDKDE